MDKNSDMAENSAVQLSAIDFAENCDLENAMIDTAESVSFSCDVDRKCFPLLFYHSQQLPQRLSSSDIPSALKPAYT